MCKGVAVMRRRSDSWLNATQILKVAGFDKPQRTRILEREVQKGEHEKVQGGYGKYQGTWIPLDRGLSLCKQYNCEHLLLPIIDFQPDASSPPLAPKHLVTPSLGKPPTRKDVATPSSTINTRSRRTAAPVVEDSDVETHSVKGSEDGTMTPSPSEASSSSRTPSPIRSSPEPVLRNEFVSPSPRPGRKRKQPPKNEAASGDERRLEANGVTPSYGDQILEYFISDTNQIPSILINPPGDFDPNISIDDDGHTALHWAAAMGRIRIVKLLLTAGADIFRVNKAGQTALMRSVMFANNYDVRKFPELYELLHRSTLNIDVNNRTVFHHIVDVAMSKGKTHAARYYMETVLNRLADYPTELADIINFADEDGETALTMAARCRSKRLVKILLDHGANPKWLNHEGKSTEDYILEDERFRSSPIIPSRPLPSSFRSVPASSSHAPNLDYLSNGDRSTLHYSVAGQRAATVCVNEATTLFDSLAASYDQELREKERDMNQANALLTNIQTEILESQRAVGLLRSQSQGLNRSKQVLEDLEQELRSKMGKRYRLGWERWLQVEEEREDAIRAAGSGEIVSIPSEDGVHRSTDGTDITDLVALHSNMPTDPNDTKDECDQVRSELAHFKKRRLETFDELVRFQAEAGTGGRMSDYRRLIATCCGGVSIENCHSRSTPPQFFDVRFCSLSVDMPIARFQALRAATIAPWTKDLRHVKAIVPRPWSIPLNGAGPRVKSVKPKDRIKWWNIVPGDQVRLRGDPESAIHEVRRVNKLTNRVYLKSLDTSENTEKQTTRPDRQVAYSRCQLLIGDNTFPPLPGETDSRTLRVFATRLSTSAPYWSPTHHRYEWNRYAVNTTPRLPGTERVRAERTKIAWPERPAQTKVDAGAYDTLESAVTELTYIAPSLPLQADGPLPEEPSAHAYIKALSSRSSTAYDAPVEVLVHKELANPHSRAKKQARWQAYQLYKRSLLQQYVRKECENLRGRTRRDARAEATWKWKQKLIEERKTEVKRRWRNRGQEEALSSKQVRKVRKEERIQKKLQNLVLEVAPNQLVPRSKLLA
ncbi:hypothetical protein EUX98_g436 [Antrodiella citrinella]|uniref:HTH APSES-type domain-containing protein n=1 Tax=Antrodiella citrinella TaxID=2447956 RepID=A0A4V3XJN7_9APHY|nr:hypothetical protein EUX98_g436 [Antrodiella citrinella]